MPEINVSIESETGVEGATVEAVDYREALFTDEVSDLIAANLSSRDEGNITIRIFAS